MDWLLRNLSMLAFILVVAMIASELFKLVGAILGGFGFAAFLGIAWWIVAVVVGYGVLVRLLGLCDDIAAIRKTQTGTSSILR